MSEGNDGLDSNSFADASDDNWQEEKLQRLVKEKIISIEENNQELRRSEERYRNMIAEVQDYAILLLDKEGIIQNWNKGANKIKQYEEPEVVGKHVRMFYLPEDRANKLPERLLNEAANNGRAAHQGWRMRKDGTKFWGSITITALHDKSGAIIGFSKVTRDLTEKKIADDELQSSRAELQKRNEALRKSEEQYHKMISEVKDYAIILLNEQGDIQNWNVGAEQIKGYSAAEIIGKNFNIFYTPEDRENKFPEQLLNQAKKTGQALHEGWRVRKDSSKFWGSIVITALHAEDGSVMGFSKVTRDLTEKKHAEDKMREYLMELEAQNKELEQFAYVASHDLQEPLRKIQMFTNIISLNFHHEIMARSYIEKINTSAQRMSDLIKSILNYSRLSDGVAVMVDIDPNEILNAVLVDFELLIQEKNATITRDYLPTISAIPLQLNQLFANLMGNALKFSHKNQQFRD